MKLKDIDTRNNEHYDTKMSPSQGKSQPTEMNHSLSPDKNGNMLGMPIPQEELAKAPMLQLYVIESASLSTGNVYEINAQGLMGSKRKTLDGVVYIGLESKNVHGDIGNTNIQ